MRTLIFSDVHANQQALMAVIAAAGHWDEAACLGDWVGYGAAPGAVLAWAQTAKVLTIRGNHDRACATGDGIASFTPDAAQSAHWTHAQLSTTERQWLAALPPGPQSWNGMLLAHGSPRDEDEYVIGLDTAAAIFAGTTDAVQWIGHTHLQGGFVLTGGVVALLGMSPTGRTELRLDPTARYLLNPGSVGQPRDGDPRAAFAIAGNPGDTVTFHRVAYDLAAAQAAILAAGLPPRLARRLQTGT
ncbi:MAG TPA: metallophosphoesterase family protein [Terriglobales bacterium]|jgi:diadenosine tetraphosphatase ApaH/serine/threonine PP2A family protein phosphatase